MDKDAGTTEDGSMNVALTPELEAFVRQKLESGMYKNASEVVREGLRLLAKRDALDDRTRRKIQEGMRQLRAGRTVDGEKAVNGIVRGLRRRRRRAKGE